MSTYPQPIPSGQAAPFAVLTDSDHGALILVSASMGIAMTLLASAIRIFIRHSVNSDWGVDDAVLAIATVRKTLRRPSLHWQLIRKRIDLLVAAIVFGSRRRRCGTGEVIEAYTR